jgi:anthranilate phosphoribosyltransferase
VLDGTAPRTATAAVVLNAAAALCVAPDGPRDFGDAIDAARSGLAGGAGLRALERLRSAYTAQRR